MMQSGWPVVKIVHYNRQAIGSWHMAKNLQRPCALRPEPYALFYPVSVWFKQGDFHANYSLF
jgi:hypothetical protein